MKNFIAFIVFAIFYQTNANAQAPLNVTITGECSNVSGVFTYNGLVNGKNNYTQNVLVNGEIFVAAVGFDNTQWVLYADGDLTDNGFSNIAVPASLLPPFTGWVNTQCPDGTMVIEELLSIGEFDNLKNKVSIFPNPTSDYITFNTIGNENNSMHYVVFDITGREMKSGNSKIDEKIGVENLANGTYILKLEDTLGHKSTHQFIKE